jgi:hypothetical protein
MCLVKHLMERGLEDFFNWYTTESGAPVQVSVLKFELSDIHRQAVRAFLVPRRERLYFQELKKLFWDIFWIESSLAGSLRLFHLHISIPGNDLGLGRRELTAAVDRIPIIPTATTDTGRDLVCTILLRQTGQVYTSCLTLTEAMNRRVAFAP